MNGSLFLGRPTMKEQSYLDVIRTERPGPLRRRRQLKWLREYEEKHGESRYLRKALGV